MLYKYARKQLLFKLRSFIDRVALLLLILNEQFLKLRCRRQKIMHFFVYLFRFSAALYRGELAAEGESLAPFFEATRRQNLSSGDVAGDLFHAETLPVNVVMSPVNFFMGDVAEEYSMYTAKKNYLLAFTVVATHFERM